MIPVPYEHNNCMDYWSWCQSEVSPILWLNFSDPREYPVLHLSLEFLKHSNIILKWVFFEKELNRIIENFFFIYNTCTGIAKHMIKSCIIPLSDSISLFSWWTSMFPLTASQISSLSTLAVLTTAAVLSPHSACAPDSTISAGIFRNKQDSSRPGLLNLSLHRHFLQYQF